MEQPERKPLLQNNGCSARPTEVPIPKTMHLYLTIPFPVFCILLTELFERMTFYSISANLIIFCSNKLGFSSSDAATIYFIFTGSCYVIPLVGGLIADYVSGRFNAIFASGLLYVLGICSLISSAVEYTLWFGPKQGISPIYRRIFALIGLSLISTGAGGMKANMGPFGSYQTQEYWHGHQEAFFQWYYFCINLGTFVAFSLVAYVQQNVNFALGLTIPVISMCCCVVSFLVGKSYYKEPTEKGMLRDDSSNNNIPNISDEESKTDCDRGLISKGGLQSVIRIIPIFTTLIMYWAIESQMSSTYLLQSVRMDVHIFSLVTPVACLNLFDVISALVLIPVLDQWVYPCLRSRNIHPTSFQRMGFGMILASLSVTYAGILEIYRKKNLSETGGFIQVIGDTSYNSSTLTMFLQVPQFVLIGASGVFTSATGLEFACCHSPPSDQGLVMGLYFLTDAFGNLVDMLIIQAIKLAPDGSSWLPHEINKGHVEYLFFLLSGLMLLNFIFFLSITRFYRRLVWPKSKETG